MLHVRLFGQSQDCLLASKDDVAQLLDAPHATHDIHQPHPFRVQSFVVWEITTTVWSNGRIKLRHNGWMSEPPGVDLEARIRADEDRLRTSMSALVDARFGVDAAHALSNLSVRMDTESQAAQVAANLSVVRKGLRIECELVAQPESGVLWLARDRDHVNIVSSIVLEERLASLQPVKQPPPTWTRFWPLGLLLLFGLVGALIATWGSIQDSVRWSLAVVGTLLAYGTGAGYDRSVGAGHR